MPEPAELVYGTELFAAAADIAYPEGYFIRTLSEAQLASIWGQETLWLTDAENEVIYDGSGVPWIVRLTVQTADGTLTAEAFAGAPAARLSGRACGGDVRG